MNKAVLIIDIQNDYFDGGAMELVDSIKAAENARLVLDYFRLQNLPVIHVQHLSNRPGAVFFLPDTTGAAIHRLVQPLDDEKVIIKHYPNSFIKTELLEYLQDNRITDLVIMGMMTHMCVDATTRAAKDYGFNCTVISDACATKDLEINGIKVIAADVQTAFMSALSYFYSTVDTAKHYITKL